MGLLKIAKVPPVVVSPETPVMRAVELMEEANVGAVAVVENGQPVGIFTERDVMNRVVLERKNPDALPVAEVMTRDVVTCRRDMQYGDALQMMVGKHFRHIPVVDADNKVTAMLSVRDLYEYAVENLSHELNAVMSYFTADGSGG